MIDIKLPNKPNPVTVLPKPELTSEEKKILEYKKKMQNRYGLIRKIFIGVLYVSTWIIVFYFVYGDKPMEMCGINIPGCIFAGLFLCIIFSTIIPLGWIIILLYDYIIPFKFKIPDSIDKKVNEPIYIIEQRQKQEREKEHYESEIKQYYVTLDSLDKKYPGLKSCQYNMKSYNEKIADEIIVKFPEIMELSAKQIELNGNLADWETCTDREFEIKTAKWYHLCGYKVELTPKSGDGGVDVIAQHGKEKIYIQCKQYKTTQVPVKVARELLGVMAAKKVNTGAIVCMLGGESGTVTFCKQNNIKIITAAEICQDIHKKSGAMKADKIPYIIKKNGNSYYYKGYGEFEFLPEPFMNTYNFIYKFKKENLILGNRNIAMVKYLSFVFPVLYDEKNKKYLSDFIVSDYVDVKTWKYEPAIKNQDLGKQTTKPRKKGYRPGYYKRYY